MPIFQTTCSSLTGPYLYSDVNTCRGPGYRHHQVPLLNRITATPFLGHIGALLRMVLAIIHTIGHTLAALFYRDTGHLYHAAKGCTEFVNGVIEFIPIVGRIYVWKRDQIDWLSVFDDSFFPDENANFFLIKIYNPEKPDAVDHFFAKKDKHPYLKHVGQCDKKPYLCHQHKPIIESITAKNLEANINVVSGIDLMNLKKGDCFVTKWGIGWECNFINGKGCRDSLHVEPTVDQTTFSCPNFENTYFANLKEIFDFYLSGHSHSESLPETLTIKLKNGQSIDYTNFFKKKLIHLQSAPEAKQTSVKPHPLPSS